MQHFYIYRANKNMEQLIYIKPWTRIGPYVVGFYTGYLLYKTECKLKMPKVTLIVICCMRKYVINNEYLQITKIYKK